METNMKEWDAPTNTINTAHDKSGSQIPSKQSS